MPYLAAWPGTHKRRKVWAVLAFGRTCLPSRQYACFPPKKTSTFGHEAARAVV